MTLLVSYSVTSPVIQDSTIENMKRQRSVTAMSSDLLLENQTRTALVARYSTWPPICIAWLYRAEASSSPRSNIITCSEVSLWWAVTSSPKIHAAHSELYRTNREFPSFHLVSISRSWMSFSFTGSGMVCEIVYKCSRTVAFLMKSELSMMQPSEALKVRLRRSPRRVMYSSSYCIGLLISVK